MAALLFVDPKTVSRWDEAGTAHLADSAARAKSAAEVTAQDAKRAAEVVAAAVAAAAHHLQKMTAAAEEACANEVTKVSAELDDLTKDTARRVAAQTQTRAAGVAHAAREAATALHDANPHHTPHDCQDSRDREQAARAEVRPTAATARQPIAD